MARYGSFLLALLWIVMAGVWGAGCTKTAGVPTIPNGVVASPTPTPGWYTLGSAAVSTGPVTFFSMAVANSTPVIAATNEYNSSSFATAYYGGCWNHLGSLSGKWTM
ncbi:MAG TPA: hypothetical protein VN963_00920, partial [bacterium]|nr:hypothetical protein [bacterium]